MTTVSPPAVEIVGAKPANRMHTLLALLGVPVLVLVSRLPFLSAGYGMNPDAWRVASVAHFLARNGDYVPSRFPGFPVQEFVSAQLSRGGPLALNTATALFSALAVLFFILILRKLGCRDALLAGIALACIPVVFICSTITLDPIWALAFLLGATYMALRRRPWLAGIFLGLATGCRITSLLFILPLYLVIVYQESQQMAADNAADDTLLAEVEDVKPAATQPVEVTPAAVLSADMAAEESAAEDEEDEEDEEEGQPMDPARRAGMIMTLVALVVAVFCFLPLYLNYGLNFLKFNNESLQLYIQLRHVTTDTWGVLGCVALLLALASQLVPAFRRGAKSFSTPPETPLLRAWIIALLLTALLFYASQQDNALYLIPCLPFVLLLLGYLLPRRIFQAVCVMLIISPLLFTLRSPREPSGPGTPPFKLMGQEFRVYLPGPILDDWQLRKAQTQYLQQTVAYSDSQPSHCWMIMLGMLAEFNMVSLEHGGAMVPLKQALHRKDYTLETSFLFQSPQRKAFYTELMSNGLIHNCLRNKVAVYFLPGAEKLEKNNYGIDIVQAGAKSMPTGAF